VRIAGIVLIVLGIVGLAFGQFRYTDRDKVLDIGPLKAETVQHKSVPIPPIAGGAAIVAGIALVVLGGRRA
jgi:uncharacterized membrane protein